MGSDNGRCLSEVPARDQRFILIVGDQTNGLGLSPVGIGQHVLN